MNANLLFKHLPLLSVLAILGFLVWPHAWPDAGPVEKPTKLPEFKPELLKIDVGEAAKADPFLGSGDTETAPRQPKPAVSRTASIAKGIVNQTAPPIAIPVRPPPDPRLHFVLNGTLSRGGHAMAVVNGRVVEAGDILNGTGAGGRPWVVWDVRDDQVDLLSEGHCLALRFAPEPPRASARAESNQTRRISSRPSTAGRKPAVQRKKGATLGRAP